MGPSLYTPMWGDDPFQIFIHLVKFVLYSHYCYLIIMVSPVAHTVRVKALYRRCLKEFLNWGYQREVFYEAVGVGMRVHQRHSFSWW